jgi:hypothetical protein
LKKVYKKCWAAVSSWVRVNSGMFLFSLRLHSLFQLNSSNNAYASCKSFVSNPSVNQP